MGVTGQTLPPKNDFEHTRGLRISAYAVNLTYDRHTYRHIYIYHAKSRLNTPVWGSLRSPNYRVVNYFDISVCFRIPSRKDCTHDVKIIIRHNRESSCVALFFSEQKIGKGSALKSLYFLKLLNSELLRCYHR